MKIQMCEIFPWSQINLRVSIFNLIGFHKSQNDFENKRSTNLEIIIKSFVDKYINAWTTNKLLLFIFHLLTTDYTVQNGLSNLFHCVHIINHKKLDLTSS